MTESISPTTLKGWKSIADYFGRDASTVMRWAAQRGLPVRRLPGEGRSSVYALPDELAAWLATAGSAGSPVSLDSAAVISPAAPGPATPEPVRAVVVPPVAQPARRIALLGVAAAMIVAAAALIAAISGPAGPAFPRTFHDAATERAYLAATYDLNLRTPASLDRARAEFGAIIARDPTAAPAYAALGETYLLLREYSVFPGDEAYRAAAAAERAAIALDPDLVAAHRALAFVAFWGDRDIPTARDEFSRARAFAPHDAQTWHWYATALSANGEAAAALDAIGEARRLAPESTPIAADYGLVAYLAGRRADGLAALNAVAAGSPTHMSTHRYLADLALARGDGATYLAEAAIACRLKNDDVEGAAVIADRAAFAHGGQAALLASIAARLDRRTAANAHFDRARIAALQGRTAAALDELRRAGEAHEAAMASMPGEIDLHGLAGNPAFEAMQPRATLAAAAAAAAARGIAIP